MPIFNIQNFLAGFMNSHGGPAKSERFYTQISPPLEIGNGVIINDLIYQCEASELPGTQLNTSTYRITGPEKTIASLTVYNEITLSFYCSNDFFEKPLFDSWIEYVNPRNLGWDFRYKDEYTGTLDVCQLDITNNNIIYQCQLRKVYPISVNPLPLHWGDDSIHRLAVTFRYDSYLPVFTFSNLFQSVLNRVGSPISGINIPNTQSAAELLPQGV